MDGFTDDVESVVTALLAYRRPIANPPAELASLCRLITAFTVSVSAREHPDDSRWHADRLRFRSVCA